MGKSSSGRPRAGSETSAPSEKRRDSKRDSTTSSRRKLSRRDDYVDEHYDATVTSSRVAPSTYVTAFTAEPSSIDAVQETPSKYNDRDRYDNSRGSRDDTPSKYRPSKGSAENDGQNSKSERDNGRDRRDSRRSGRSDDRTSARASDNHDASLPQNQFPGEMPLTYTQPYRPPGQASSYYGDQGESVSFQPGVRPIQPSIVTNAEQAHLMEPTIDARPPAEPSSLGQVGAAAGYFGNSGFANDSGVQSTPSKPSQRLDHNRPDQSGGFDTSPRASPSPGGYQDRPSQQASGGGAHFAPPTAAEYYSGSAFQTPPRLPQGSFEGSGPYSAPAGAGASFANSNVPLYGAAGMAAGAAYLHHHNNQQSHWPSGMSNAGPYSSGPTQMQHRHEHKHKHRSPLGKFVDWFRDPKAVAEYEQYTEAIGVCKYCFDPMSSPADAPRRHHYRPKRTSSGSRYGSSTRVDKTYRYSSDEERKRRSGAKKVVAGGLAGYGAAKVGNAILKANHDFDDTYSVKSGRPFTASRVSFQGEEMRSTSKSKQRYSSTEDLRGSHEKRRESHSNEATRRRDKHSSRRRESSSSSSSHGISRGVALSTGIGAAGLAMGAAALNKKSRRDSRDRSRSRSPPSRKKYYSKRVSPMHSYVDLSTTNSGPTSVAGFFTSPSANKKKGKKPKGFFTFSNGSSSSSDADLAYGAGTVRTKRSSRRLSASHDRNKQYASAAGMMGLVKLGNDLASESDRRGHKGKRVSDAHSKVGPDSRFSSNGFYMQDQAQIPTIGQDEEWYDTDDSDGGLVYGSGTSLLPRREPGPQPPRYPSDHYQRAQAGGNDSSRRQSASYNQSQNGDPKKFTASFETTETAPAMDFTGKPPPMQELEPRPISNDASFDTRRSRRDSYHNGQQYQTSSSSVPLHQPQPVPIIPFINQSMNTSLSQGTGSTDYRRTKPLLENMGANRNIGSEPSDRRSSRRSRRDSSPAKLLSQDPKNNVSFDLSNEQLDNERKSSKKDDARESRRDKKDRRKSADAALVLGAGALIAGALAKDQMSDKGKSSDSVRDAPSQASTREADIDRQLQALYDEKRRQEEHKRTLERLEQGNKSTTSGKPTGPELVKRSSSSEDSSRPRRKSSLKKNNAREVSPTSDTQQERIARMAAQRVKSTPSPVHEDYGNFFVPQELVEHLKEHNEKAEHRDDVEPNVVEIVPGASKSKGRNPFDPFLYRPFGLDVDDDPSLHPWPVPMLGLVEPTPPGSRAHSDRGDITPVARPSSVEPPHDEGEPLERKASNGTKVTWGDHDTYVYEVQTPEYERSDYIPDHKEAGRKDDSKREEPKISHGENSTEQRPKAGRTWTLDETEAELLEREVPSVSERPHVSRAWTVDDKEADQIEHPARSSHADVLDDVTPQVVEIRPRQVEASPSRDAKPTQLDTANASPRAEEGAEPLREVYQSPFAETASDLGLSDEQRHLPDSPDGRMSLGMSDLQDKPQDADTDFPDVRSSKSEKRRRERASSSIETADEHSTFSTNPRENATAPSDRESVFDFLVEDGGKSVAAAAAIGLGAAAISAAHQSSKEPSQHTSDRNIDLDDDVVGNRAGVKRSSTFDDSQLQRQPHSSSRSDPQSDPEDWERSRTSKNAKGTKRSAQSDVGLGGKGSSESKDEVRPDDLLFEKPRRSHTESEIGDDFDTKSSASGRKRKSKRSERSNGQSREDSASRVEDAEKPRRKSKRDSQIFDDGDVQSVVSSPADLDKYSKEKDKKSSGGFFSNIFSSNKSDVSTSSKRSSKSSKSESRAERPREEGSESRKKHRSKDRDLDDAATAVSEPLRSSKRSSERPRKDKSEKTYSRDESLDDGFVSAEESTEVPAFDDGDEKSFLGKRPEMPQPTDIAMPMDTDGVSGLASGRISSKTPRATDAFSPDTRTGDDFEAFVARNLNVEGASDLPSKPSAARRRLSAIQTREPESNPTTPGFPTATSVPVHFRIPASSPIAPRFSMSSPIASPASPLTTPRTRQGRPKSTEFAGKNIRPLYLVEASNPSKNALPDTSDYPPLPPSIASSSHPSTEDLRAEAQAQEQLELFTPSRLTADKFRDQARRQSYSYWHDGEQRRRSPDYLDSRSATPVPGEAQRARDREIKPKPKYEFHSPSELLQDPSLLYGDGDMEDDRPGSPLPSVVSTDLDYMSARSRSLSPPSRARSLSRGRRSASGSRSTSVSWQDAVSTVAAGALVGSALGYVAHEALNESSFTVPERDVSAVRRHLDTESVQRQESLDSTAHRGRPAERRLEINDLPTSTAVDMQDEPLDQDTEVEMPYSDADARTTSVAATKTSKKTKKDKKKQKRQQLTSTLSDDLLPSSEDPAQITSKMPEASSRSDSMAHELQSSELHDETQVTARDLSALVDREVEGMEGLSRTDKIDDFQNQSNMHENTNAPGLGHYDDPSLKDSAQSLSQSPSQRPHTELSPFEQALEAAVHARGLSQGTTMEVAHDAFLPDAPTDLPDNGGTSLTTIEEENESVSPAVQMNKAVPERKNSKKSKRKDKKSLDWEPASETQEAEAVFGQTPSDQPKSAEPESFAQERDSTPNPFGNDFVVTDEDVITSTPPRIEIPDSSVSASELMANTDSLSGLAHDPKTSQEVDDWPTPTTKKGKKDKKGRKGQSLNPEESAEMAVPTEPQSPTVAMPNVEHKSTSGEQALVESHSADPMLVDPMLVDSEQTSTQNDQVRLDDTFVQDKNEEAPASENADDTWDTGAKKSKKSKKGKRKSLTWADEENLTSFAAAPTEDAFPSATDPVLDAAQSGQAIVPASQEKKIIAEQPKELREESEVRAPTSTNDSSRVTPEEPEFDDFYSTKSTKKSKKKQKKRDSDALVAGAAMGAVGALALGPLHTGGPDADQAVTVTADAPMITITPDHKSSNSGVTQDLPARDDNEGTSVREVVDFSNSTESLSTSPTLLPSADDGTSEPLRSFDSEVQPPAELPKASLDQVSEDLFPLVGKKSKKDKKKMRQSTIDEFSTEPIADTASYAIVDSKPNEEDNVIDASELTPQSSQLQDPEAEQPETQEVADDFGFADKKMSKKDKKKKHQSTFEPETDVFEDAVSSPVPDDVPIETEAVTGPSDSIQRMLELQDSAPAQEEVQEAADNSGFIDKKKAKKDKKKKRQSTFDEPDANVDEKVTSTSVAETEFIDKVDDNQNAELSTLPTATGNQEEIEDFGILDKKKSKKDKRKQRHATFDEPEENAADVVVPTSAAEGESIAKVDDIEAEAPSTLLTENQDEAVEDFGFVDKKKSKKDKKKKRQSTFDAFEIPSETITSTPAAQDAELPAVSRTNSTHPDPVAFVDELAPIGKQSKKDKKKKRASAVQFASPEQLPTSAGVDDLRSPGAFDLNDEAIPTGEEPQAFQSEPRGRDDHSIPEDSAPVTSSDDSRAVEPTVVETSMVEPLPEASVDETPTRVPASDDAQDVTDALGYLRDDHALRTGDYPVVDTPAVEIPTSVPVPDNAQDVTAASKGMEGEATPQEAASEISGEQEPTIGVSDIVAVPKGSSSETDQPSADVSTNELNVTDDTIAAPKDLGDNAPDEWEPTPKKSKKDKRKKKQNALDDSAEGATILEDKSTSLAKDSTSEPAASLFTDQSGLLDTPIIAATVAMASHDQKIEDDEWNSSTKKSKKDKKKKRQSALTSPPDELDVTYNDAADKPDELPAAQLMPAEVSSTEAPAEAESTAGPEAAEDEEWGYSSKKLKKDKKKKRQSLLSTPPNEQEVPTSDTIDKFELLSTEPTIAPSPEPLDPSADGSVEKNPLKQPEVAEEGDWGFTSKKSKKDKKKKRQSLMTTPPNESEPTAMGDDNTPGFGALPTESETAKEPIVMETSSDRAIAGEAVIDVVPDPEPEWGYSTKKSKNDKKKRRSGFEDSVPDNDAPEPDSTISTMQEPAQNLDEAAKTAESVEPTRDLVSDELSKESGTVPNQSPAAEDDVWPVKSKKSKKDKRKSKMTDFSPFETDGSSFAAETSAMDTSRGIEESILHDDAMAMAIAIGDPTTEFSNANQDPLPANTSFENKVTQPENNEAPNPGSIEQETIGTDDLDSFSMKKSKKDKKKKKRQSTFDDAYDEPESTTLTAAVLATDRELPSPSTELDVAKVASDGDVAETEVDTGQTVEADEQSSAPVVLTKTSEDAATVDKPLQDPVGATVETEFDTQPIESTSRVIDAEAEPDFSTSLKKSKKDKKKKRISSFDDALENVQDPTLAKDIVDDPEPLTAFDESREASGTAEGTALDTQAMVSASKEIDIDAGHDFSTPSKKSKKEKKEKRTSTFDDTFEGAASEPIASEDTATEPQPAPISEEPLRDRTDAPKDPAIEIYPTEVATREIEPDADPKLTTLSQEKKEKRLSTFDDAFEDAVEEPIVSEDIAMLDVQPAYPESMEPDAEAEFTTTSKKSKKDKKKKRISTFDDTADVSPQQPVAISQNAVVDAQLVESIIKPEAQDEFEVPSKKSKKNKKKRVSAFDDLVDEPTQDLETLPEVLASDLQTTGVATTDEPTKDLETTEVLADDVETAKPSTTDEASITPEAEGETFSTSSKKSKKDKKKNRMPAFDDSFTDTINESSRDLEVAPETLAPNAPAVEPLATDDPATAAEPQEDEFYTSSKKSKKGKKKNRAMFDDMAKELEEPAEVPKLLDADTKSSEPFLTADPTTVTEPEEEFVTLGKKSKKDKKKRMSTFDDTIEEPRDQIATPKVLESDPIETFATTEPTTDLNPEEEDSMTSSKKSKKDKKKKRMSTFDDIVDEPEDGGSAHGILDPDAPLTGPDIVTEEDFVESANKSKKDKKKKRQATFDDTFDEPKQEVEDLETAATSNEPTSFADPEDESEFIQTSKKSKKDKKKKRQSTFDEPQQDVVVPGAHEPDALSAEPAMVAEPEPEPEDEFGEPLKRSKKDKKKQRQSTFDDMIDEPKQEAPTTEILDADDTISAEPVWPTKPEADDQLIEPSKKSKKDKKKKRQSTFDDTVDEPSRAIVVYPLEGRSTEPQSIELAIAPEADEEFTMPSKKSKKKKRQSTFGDILDEPGQDLVAPPAEVLTTDDQPVDPPVTARDEDEADSVFSSKNSEKDKQNKGQPANEDTSPAYQELLTPDLQESAPTLESESQRMQGVEFNPNGSHGQAMDVDTSEQIIATECDRQPSDSAPTWLAVADHATAEESFDMVNSSAQNQAAEVTMTDVGQVEESFNNIPSKNDQESRGVETHGTDASLLTDVPHSQQPELGQEATVSENRDLDDAEVSQADWNFSSIKPKKDKKKRQSTLNEPVAFPIEEDTFTLAAAAHSKAVTEKFVDTEVFPMSSKKSKKDKKKRQSTLDETVADSYDNVTTLQADTPSIEVPETPADAEPDWGLSSKKSKKDKKKRQSTIEAIDSEPFQEDTLTPQADITMEDTTKELAGVDFQSTSLRRELDRALEPDNKDIEHNIIHTTEHSQHESPPVAEPPIEADANTQPGQIVPNEDRDRLESVIRGNEFTTATTVEPSQHETSNNIGFEIPQQKSKKDKKKTRQSKSAQIDWEEPQPESEDIRDQAIIEATQEPRELSSANEKTTFEHSRHVVRQESWDEMEVDERRASLTKPAALNDESIQETARSTSDNDGAFLGAVAATGAAVVLASELAAPSKKSKKDKKKKRQSTLDEEAFGAPTSFQGPSTEDSSFKDVPDENAPVQHSTSKDIPHENISIQDPVPTDDWVFSGKKSKKSKKMMNNFDDLGDKMQTSGTGTPRSADQFDTAVQTPMDQIGVVPSIETQDAVVDPDSVPEPPTEDYFPAIDRKTSKKDKKKQKKMPSAWVEADNQGFSEFQDGAAKDLAAENSASQPKNESQLIEDHSRVMQHEEVPRASLDMMDVDKREDPMFRDHGERIRQRKSHISRSPEPYQSIQHEKYESSTRPDQVDLTERSLAADAETISDNDPRHLVQTEPQSIIVDDTIAPRRTKSKNSKKDKRIFEFNGTENIDSPSLPNDEQLYAHPVAIPRDGQMVSVADRSTEPNKTTDYQVHSDPENLSDVSASTRERRKRRRSPPVWAGEEPDDLPRNRAMTPPPEHDDLMDTALGVAAGLGFGVAGHESSRNPRPRSTSPARKQSTGWSFAKLGTVADLGNTDSNRDSGVQFESPVLPIDHFTSTRDSGFVAEPSERSRGGSTDRGLDVSLRPPRPQSPTSSTEDVSKKRHSKSRKDDMSTLETPRRRPSPVDSTSKERSSVLFNSSPAVPTPLKTNIAPISPEPVSSPLRRSPSIHGHHQSREELKQKSRVSPHDHDFNDALASNLIDRSAKAEVQRDAFSPGPEGSARFAAHRMSLNTIREDAVDSSGPTRDQHPFTSPPFPLTPQARGSKDHLAEAGLAAAAVGALGVRALALSKTNSRDSELGQAKSLGRSKSRTSSLRNLRASAASPYDAINAAAGPSHISVNDTELEGPGSRTRDMSDVYDGYGSYPGSPRSPTRPPSVRRRQSMQQIKDLESQLDQLASENRALVEAKMMAEQQLETAHFDRSRSEGTDTISAQLQERDAEISYLKEQVASLMATHETLQREHEQTLATVRSDYEHDQLQWGESARELETLRSRHTELSQGMESIVRHEIDTALAEKNAEIERLRQDLEEAREKVRELQSQIVAGGADEVLTVRDEDYFDSACQQLCQQVQGWVLRFSKYSDTRLCRTTNEVRDEKIVDRFDNAILDGSDVDLYLADRVKRRDVFMSVVMTMIWEYVFTRYLFGMDRDQRQKLKQLEKNLGEVGPASAVHQWRALTLTLLSKRESFQAQRDSDAEAVSLEIFSTLSRFLPPPQNLEGQIVGSLRNVMLTAVNLSIEMRLQRAEYIMLPPLQPEYDTNGDLARKVYFNASLMNERSGETTSNDELERNQAVVRMVLFPLVVKKGDDSGVGDEEIVVCPAQVLIARPDKGKRPRGSTRVASGDSKSLRAVSTHSLGAMSGIDVNENMI
ncbi:hypothetical protein LTR84_001226 [Exophiala bonariae]|uniref:Involucrin repeat protein n=1 Tax=Exophiala bonariae TaxID=1690606 RepID=A0AAV9NWU5_9EURO|nr:hypothetical protein LTR84_001226 [Exophiala bonariae]